MKHLEKEVEKIRKKVNEITEIMDNALPKIKKSIDYIIKNKIKSSEIIEPLLDSLLNYTGMNKGQDEFIKLNNYYDSFNKKNARMYADSFRKITEN